MDKRVRQVVFCCIAAFFIIGVGGATLRSSSALLPYYQNPPTQQKKNQEVEKIEAEARRLWYDRDINPDAKIFTGDVNFHHKGAVMKCDSALLYEQRNAIESFGNVHIIQGDSLHITCDYLDYDGISLIARLRGNVIMRHGENTLFTDSLDYDRNIGLGYYFEGGTIVDSLNTLTSQYGEYYTDNKTAIFKFDVKLENPNFTLYSDKLFYNTETKVADIKSPSRIVGDSGYILTSKGVYDTQRDIAYLLDKSKLYSGSRTATGDSMVYSRSESLAKLFGNVELKDTAENVSLHGEYAEYHEKEGKGLARDNAYVMDFSSKDTLWAHALEMQLIRDTINGDIVKGLENVRIYRKDVQAVSDTLLYRSKDSVLNLLGKPIIWSDSSQISGDTIRLFMKDGNPYKAQISNNALVSMELTEDLFYNQMVGNEILAYFNDNKMDSVRTSGNAETIYYTVEGDSVVSSQVRVQSASILMLFQKEELESISFLEKTKGIVNPIFLVESKNYNFSNFFWFATGRPLFPKDIFRTTPNRAKKEDKEKKEESSETGSLNIANREEETNTP